MQMPVDEGKRNSLSQKSVTEKKATEFDVKLLCPKKAQDAQDLRKSVIEEIAKEVSSRDFDLRKKLEMKITKNLVQNKHIETPSNA